MNDTTTIQCAVTTNDENTVCLKWILPVNSSNRITVSDKDRTPKRNSKQVTSKNLTINQATIEDAGLYICRVRLINDRDEYLIVAIIGQDSRGSIFR